MPTVVAAPIPILQFFDNTGAPAVGGSVHTQVGGLDYPTYQDSAGTIPLQNPIPLNSRGEISNAAGASCQLFVVPNTVYTFTVHDRDGNLLTQSSYVNGTQLTAAQIATMSITAGVLDSLGRTTAEVAAGVTPVNYAYAPYEDSLRYGAAGDGSTDDATALGNQIAAASSGLTGYASRKIGLTAPDSGAVSFKCASGLTLNPLKIVFTGNGNTLDFSSISSAFSGVTLDTAGLQTDIATVAVQVTARPLRDLVILMPSYTTNANGVGLTITDSVGDGGGNYFSCCHTIENVSIFGGAYGIKFGNAGFALRFNNCTILHGTGHLSDIGIYAPSTWASTDGAEQVNFYGTFGGGHRIFCWLTGGTIKFHGGNIDGCKTYAKQDGLGTIALYGTYSEFTDGDDTQYKFDCNDVHARIDLVNCEFGVREDAGVRATKAFGNVTGHMNFVNNRFYESVGSTQWYTANGGFLFTGTGHINASGNVYKDFPWSPLVSKKHQWLGYPDIDNANALAAFTLSKVGAGVNPVRASTVSDGSTSRDAIDFQIGAGAVANDDSAAVFTHSVIPERTVSIVGAYYCPSITGANVTLEIVAFSFKDSAGNVLLGPFSQTLTSTSVATWSTFTGLTSTVPQGAETMTVTIRLRATGAVASAVHCYISPLGIGYAEGS